MSQQHTILDRDGEAVEFGEALARIAAADTDEALRVERFYLVPVDSVDDEPIAVLGGLVDQSVTDDRIADVTGIDPRTPFEQRVLPPLPSLQRAVDDAQQAHDEALFFGKG